MWHKINPKNHSEFHHSSSRSSLTSNKSSTSWDLAFLSFMVELAGFYSITLTILRLTDFLTLLQRKLCVNKKIFILDQSFLGRAIYGVWVFKWFVFRRGTGHKFCPLWWTRDFHSLITHWTWQLSWRGYIPGCPSKVHIAFVLVICLQRK